MSEFRQRLETMRDLSHDIDDFDDVASHSHTHASPSREPSLHIAAVIIAVVVVFGASWHLTGGQLDVAGMMEDISMFVEEFDIAEYFDNGVIQRRHFVPTRFFFEGDWKYGNIQTETELSTVRKQASGMFNTTISLVKWIPTSHRWQKIVNTHQFWDAMDAMANRGMVPKLYFFEDENASNRMKAPHESAHDGDESVDDGIVRLGGANGVPIEFGAFAVGTVMFVVLTLTRVAFSRTDWLLLTSFSFAGGSVAFAVTYFASGLTKAPMAIVIIGVVGWSALWYMFPTEWVLSSEFDYNEWAKSVNRDMKRSSGHAGDSDGQTKLQREIDAARQRVDSMVAQQRPQKTKSGVKSD